MDFIRIGDDEKLRGFSIAAFEHERNNSQQHNGCGAVNSGSQTLLKEWRDTGAAAGQEKPKNLVETPPYATAVYLMEASVIVRALNPTMGSRWRYRASTDARIGDCIAVANKWADTRARCLKVL